MKKTSIVIALTALLAFGCKNKSTSSSTPSDNVATTSVSQTLTPEELGELGAKIKKNPDDAQKLLSEKGLTTESFEQQVRKVSEDPEASKKYAAAYRKTT